MSNSPPPALSFLPQPVLLTDGHKRGSTDTKPYYLARLTSNCNRYSGNVVGIPVGYGGHLCVNIVSKSKSLTTCATTTFRPEDVAQFLEVGYRLQDQTFDEDAEPFSSFVCVRAITLLEAQEIWDSREDLDSKLRTLHAASEDEAVRDVASEIWDRHL